MEKEKREDENMQDELAEELTDSLPLLEEEGVTQRVMPMIPLRGLTVFPCMVLHFDIGRERSVCALEKAMMQNQTVFLAAQKDPETDLPTRDDFYYVGTIAKIKQMLRLPGDTIRVLVEGVERGEILEVIHEVPYFKCRVMEIPEPEIEDLDSEMVARMRNCLSTFEAYLSANPKLNDDIYGSVATVDQPGRLADIITSHLEMKIEDKQAVLEAFDVGERLELVSQLLLKETEILNLENEIGSKVRKQMDKSQREYYLREQLRAIQEELGVAEDIDEEILRWRKQVKKLRLPAKTAAKVEKEIGRISKIQPSSPEGGIIRTYIETMLELPWHKYTKDNTDLKKAARILDEDHYGLEKVKERVLEYLAVMQLSNGLKGPILCLVGPPGTGKTSISKSIARALGRNFVRMSLGGVRDEAEIRGHRRTYIGAIPGRIISSMKEAESMNPVFLFDEIDKIGADFRGDPASALLEVLDPEQNKDFTDHYLEAPFDLSKVMFITTANSVETIPQPLLDRMELIEVSGYTEEDKLLIAQKYLLPKEIKENGMQPGQLHLTEAAIRAVINGYTRESGVRSLERQIATICRKAARRIVEEKKKSVRVGEANLEHYLGKVRYRGDKLEGEDRVGVCTGLAWTAVGGTTLSVEVISMPGKGNVELTGQLGDVMQESARAGVSYIRAHCAELGISEDFHKDKDLHIHVPEGATPKDGPSAGITMCTAVVSALSGRPVRSDIAMTGEITLRGKVLPVGGIREKVLAAHRIGIRTVILPAENERDIEEIPANVRRVMEFIPVEEVGQVLEKALVR